MTRRFISLLLLMILASEALSADVRLKDIGRIEQSRTHTLVGYGLVIGLAGTGDSSRNKMTVQSLVNTLSRFGIKLDDSEVNSKNVAAVMISAELPPYSEIGSTFDISVSSIGDAKSLAGGELLVTPLNGVDEIIYGFAKGALTTGGYYAESFSNVSTKNHTTSGLIARGGILERPISGAVIHGAEVNIYLDEPDYTTAVRLVEAILTSRISASAHAEHAGKIVARMPEGTSPMSFVARLESLRIEPDVVSRVVVNEKTGTIVSGGEVLIGSVSISHGSLKIQIETEFNASQPSGFIGSARNISTVVVPETSIQVNEDRRKPISLRDGATVADLVVALNAVDLTTRDIISILQAIKSAGALHAELVIK